MAEPFVAVDISELGDEQLSKNLAQIERAVQKKIVRKALRKAAKEIILPHAKALAPVDTGRLRKSLKIRAAKRSRNRIGVKLEAGTREKLGIPADAKGYYPLALELGYVNRGGQFEKPWPYMRPALYDNRAELTGRVAELIGEGIEAEAAKVPKNG